MGARMINTLAVLFLTSTAAFAHHPFFAEFDRDRPFTLIGAVTKVDWDNPHAYLYLEVHGVGGTMTNWKVELGPRDRLIKEGWNENYLKVGDRVIIEGWRARKELNVANAGTLTLATGKKLSAASSFDLEQSGQATASSAPALEAVSQVASARQNLPRTATASPLYALLGFVSMIGGLGFLAMRRQSCG